MMGAIMCLGVATANSVLVVTFARNNLQEGMDSVKAAWEAGTGRLRPVIMTATAMIIGMLPMALGLGEGGEQNAPLGRAVRSEEHTSELQSLRHLVCRLLLEKN